MPVTPIDEVESDFNRADAVCENVNADRPEQSDSLIEGSTDISTMTDHRLCADSDDNVRALMRWAIASYVNAEAEAAALSIAAKGEIA